MSSPTTDAVTFADEFPEASREDWLAGVRKVLTRGKPDATDEDVTRLFARQLVTATEDGFDLQPLYTADDAPPPRAEPGEAPFVRSTSAAPRDWEIRQRVWADVDDSDAVTELEQGATGLLLELTGTESTEALDRLLDGVLLDLAPVSLSTPASDVGTAVARSMLALWDARSIAADDRTGTLGVDPIGAWARSGGTVDLPAALDGLVGLVNDVADAAPRVRPLVADGTVWHDAGASAGQELGWTIAGAATVVRHLIGAGVDAERAFGAVEFRWAATADQFETITKLRAARGLWARVAELSGVDVDAARMFQHADASRPMLTRYDPWVNTLRSTVACFGAAVGGADAVSVPPHDVLIEPGGSALGRRIARNTQSVLLLESNLARVVDLAGGSWYVERRTDDVADAAWSNLQDVERAGGLIAAVEHGTVRAALNDVVARRRAAVATRRRPLTGVTEFPDATETPPPPTASTPSPEAGDDGTAFEPFTLVRLAAEVEQIRGRVDAAERAGRQRPRVFLAALGGLAAATARATFAKNLFAVAGIETIDGEVGDFDPTVTTVTCLCSSDPVYAAEGAAAARALRDAGATTVFVAGRDLDLDGVDDEVGLGTDVVDFLSRLLDEMGVPT